MIKERLQTAVLGFGNPVRSDDAVGLYVVAALRERLGGREDISVFDMGTSAFEILFKLKGHNRIIIVDAVLDSGEQDGTLFCLPASAIQAQINDDPMVFLHGMKWDQALSYAKKIMGSEFPEDNISVYLLAITEIKMNMELSKTVQAAADTLVERMLNDLAL